MKFTPSFFSKPKQSQSSNAKEKKINNDNNSNNNNNTNTSNSSVLNQSKWIVGNIGMGNSCHYSSFPSFMILGVGAKLIYCFLDWLLLAFFVAESFTITHSLEINIAATATYIIIAILVDEMWSSMCMNQSLHRSSRHQAPHTTVLLWTLLISMTNYFVFHYTLKAIFLGITHYRNSRIMSSLI